MLMVSEERVDPASQPHIGRIERVHLSPPFFHWSRRPRSLQFQRQHPWTSSVSHPQPHQLARHDADFAMASPNEPSAATISLKTQSRDCFLPTMTDLELPPPRPGRNPSPSSNLRTHDQTRKTELPLPLCLAVLETVGPSFASANGHATRCPAIGGKYIVSRQRRKNQVRSSRACDRGGVEASYQRMPAATSRRSVAHRPSDPNKVPRAETWKAWVRRSPGPQDGYDGVQVRRRTAGR